MEKQQEILTAKEAGWMPLCDSKGWKCSHCGMSPPFPEKEFFFETGMCSWCAWILSKDDLIGW